MDIREVVSAYYSIYEGKKKEEKEEKPEKWFDDDGDGKGYEKGEVDGKFDKKKKKKEEDEEEVDEGLEFVDDLTEEELDEIVGDMVEAYLEEGYDLDELDLIFAEYLEEAKVTYGHDSGGKSDDDMVSKVRAKKAEKSKKRQKRIEDIKTSISKKIKAVKNLPRDAKALAHKPLVDYAAKATKTSTSKDGGITKKTALKGRGVMPSNPDKDGKSKSMLRKSDIQSKISGAATPEKAKAGRKQLRSVVVQDLKKRAGSKVKQATAPARKAIAHQKAKGAVKDYNRKQDAEAKSKLGGPTSVKGVWTRRGEAVKKAAKNVTDKVTAAPRKAVKAVRNKTASALSSLADKIKSEGIELDAFDTVTAYLIDEGFATTFDEAQKIMTTLDSELIKEVHEHQLNEAMLLTKADKVGNTPAWQNRDKKNVKTGEPIYKKADHLKKEDK